MRTVSSIHSIFAYVITMKVCRVTSLGVTGAYDVSDQNLMTKAKCVGSLSVRSHYIDGRLATDLLKINASDLRQSRVFSYRNTDDRTSFPCKHETLASAVREDPVANKTLENK